MEFDQEELLRKLDADGLTQVRNDFEDGVYGKNSSRPEYRVVEAWLEGQHRQVAENFRTSFTEPQRSVITITLLVLFFGYAIYLFLR